MFGLLKFSNNAMPSQWLWLAPLLMVACLRVAPAQADAIHAGDIELEIDGGKLVTHNGRYFESAFPETAPFDSTTPGFDSAPGLLVYDEEAEVAEEIGFNVLGPLLYWNGSEMVAPQSGLGLTLSMLGQSVSVTGANTSGVTGFSLGGASADGSFHKHFYFSVPSDADAGAYGVLLQLTPAGASTFTASDPFLIVLNRGLTPGAFETGVDAMVEVTAVPEPSSVVLAGLGAAGVLAAGWRRRRRAVAQNSVVAEIVG